MNVGNASDKIQQLFIIKKKTKQKATPRKLGVGGNFLNPIKSIKKKKKE